MPEEQAYLMNAQEQVNSYLHHIDEALDSAYEDDMREHTGQAMPYGQNALIILEDVLDDIEDSDLADRVEASMLHLGMSLEQGELVMESSDDNLEETIAEMRRQADLSMGYLNDLVAMNPY